MVEAKALMEETYEDLKDACEVVEPAVAYAVSDGLLDGFASRGGGPRAAREFRKSTRDWRSRSREIAGLRRRNGVQT